MNNSVEWTCRKKTVDTFVDYVNSTGTKKKIIDSLI